MPDLTGKNTNKSTTQSNSANETLATNVVNSHSVAELVMLATSNRLVKNVPEARSYLEQCALIAVNNNFTTETLSNILLALTIDSKLPEHTSTIIKAIALLLTGKITKMTSINYFAELTKKILKPQHAVNKELQCNCDFIKASTSHQSKHTLMITEATAKLCNHPETQ